MKKTIPDTTLSKFLHELCDNTLMHGNNGVLKVPLITMQQNLIKIAERASQLNDPVLNKIMADMTMYEIVDPSSDIYDPEAIKKIYQKFIDYKKL